MATIAETRLMNDSTRARLNTSHVGKVTDAAAAIRRVTSPMRIRLSLFCLATESNERRGTADPCNKAGQE